MHFTGAPALRRNEINDDLVAGRELDVSDFNVQTDDLEVVEDHKIVSAPDGIKLVGVANHDVACLITGRVRVA